MENRIEEERVVPGEQGLRPLQAVRVTPCGIEPTYNLTMRAPLHNYFVNGVLTANSHAVCYSVLAYRIAYLKAHYPAHFWAAVLTNELHDGEKVARYIEAARKQQVESLPPDINTSQQGFTVADGKIRCGLMAIKGLGEAAVTALLATRDAQGPFQSLFDLAARVPGKILTKRGLENLIQSGALDGLPGTRAQKFAAVDAALAFRARVQRSPAGRQPSLFALSDEKNETSAPPPPLPAVSDWSVHERLMRERRALGFYLTGHPMAMFRRSLQTFAVRPAVEPAFHSVELEVRIGGVVNAPTVKNTKRGDRFAIFTLEDETGTLETIVWPEVFRKTAAHVLDGELVVVTGRAEYVDGVRVRMTAQVVEPLELFLGRRAETVTLHFEKTFPSEAQLAGLADLLPRHAGRCRLQFSVRLPSGGAAVLQAPEPVRVRASTSFISAVSVLLPGVQAEAAGQLSPANDAPKSE